MDTPINGIIKKIKTTRILNHGFLANFEIIKTRIYASTQKANIEKVAILVRMICRVMSFVKAINRFVNNPSAKTYANFLGKMICDKGFIDLVFIFNRFNKMIAKIWVINACAKAASNIAIG